MLEAIKYNLAHLTDFTGREGRKSFWLWLLAVALINVVVTVGLSAVLTADALSAAMAAAKGNDPAAIEAAVMRQMLPNMPMIVWSSIALSALNAVLLGAAFVRRLHDGGFTGWLVLLPLAFLVAAAVFSLQQLVHIEDLVRAAMDAQTSGDLSALEQGAGWQGLIGWVPLLIVAGFGALKSQPQANRWGEGLADA